jgi:hypothetical protein
MDPCDLVKIGAWRLAAAKRSESRPRKPVENRTQPVGGFGMVPPGIMIETCLMGVKEGCHLSSGTGSQMEAWNHVSHSNDNGYHAAQGRSPARIH